MDHKKKILIVLAGVILLGMLSGAIVLFVSKQKVETTEVNSDQEMVPTKPLEKQTSMLIWDDPAGFTFQYPEGWNINKHDEDQENYAHVEFTNPKFGTGSVIVWAKDTTALDVNAWVKTDKTFVGGVIKDVTLSGKPAKEIYLETANKIIVGTIFDELLFMIEAPVTPGVKNYTDLKDIIVKNFNLKSIVDAPSNTNSEEAVDEEEVIQ